ncbi:DeoR family transcriptional regulator, partial [Raoultella planticola]|nr:DeoR family transcriptional regulator [Raoultella planticola]
RDIEELQKNGQVKVIFGGQVIRDSLMKVQNIKIKAQHHIAWKKDSAPGL